MTTARRPTEERRAEIADAALRLIASRGIASLTVSALAAELGLTGGALYRHFPSTDAILVAVAARVVALLDAATPADDLAPRAWIRQLAAARTATVSGHAGLSRMLLSDQLALALPAPALALLSGAIRRTREGVVRALAEGQARGEFRADLTPEAMAPVVLGAIQMAAMHRAGTALPRAPGDPLAVVDTLLALLAAPAGPTTRRTTRATGRTKSSP